MGGYFSQFGINEIIGAGLVFGWWGYKLFRNIREIWLGDEV